MKAKLTVFFIIYLVTANYCQSQNEPLGYWKDYLSYQDGLTVCQGGGNIYCCCSSGVFSCNLSNYSLQRYNKVTGLSDIGCTVARYNTVTNTLVVGYTDGNIDLVTNNQVVNIPDLKNSSAQGSKTINNIYFSNNLAYISCGQGLLIVDLYQDIILTTCNIGPLGSALNVYSVTILNDTIFAATGSGIYKISLYDPNLQNYQDWQVVTQLPSGTGIIYNAIVSCGNKVFASFSGRLTFPNESSPIYDTLYVYNSGKWSYFIDTSKNSHDTIVHGHDFIISLESSTVNNTPYLVYCNLYAVQAFDTLGNRQISINNYLLPYNVRPDDAILDNNLNTWIADQEIGLVKSEGSYQTAQSFIPPGPFSNSIFSMAVKGSTMYIAPGGYDQGQNPLYISGIGVSEYSDNFWYRLLGSGTQDSISKFFDLCCVAIDPKNPLHAFAGTWGEGIIEYDTNAIINTYGSYNSTLQNNEGAKTYDVQVGGVGFDTNSNLWVTNSSVNSDYLSVMHPNGMWQTFNFNGIVPNDIVATQLLITKTGAKWVLFPGNGILAYQDNGTFAAPNASNSVFITAAVGNGDLPSLAIYCMTEDLNGAIWIGNNTQVVVFYSPDNVFNGPGGWDAQNIYVQQTGYTQYLMQNQFSNCIVVDGANRKWIGTLGGGVFLMSADGTQQILNFTAENSPLLSDNILSMGIDQVTGEVFFGTDQGLVSYRGTATEGNAAFTNVYAYPDPVPHGYSGPIAINNLVTNSDVKIATVSGEIVYHTVALGGQAIWYGTNFNGERVQTGVYLVFCTSPDGTQSIVTKLLLVN